MIRTRATRLQRSRLLTIASLVVTLAGSACTGSTVGLKPHVEQRTAAPTPQDAAHPCKHASKNESLATPEAAVNLYLESIAANDFSCALRAYAAHEHAARFNFTALVSWVGVLSPARIEAPAEYPMFVEMNELRAKAEMAEATKQFVYGLLTDKDPAGSQTVQSDAEIQAFVQAVNPARLATLRVVRIDQPRQSVTNGPEAQALFKKLSTLYGADEMTERIALYELSGQFFWSGFTLCRYDKTWKIYKFESNYGGPISGGTFTGGVVRKTTAAEYEAHLR
jgi:hypothetical protein